MNFTPADNYKDLLIQARALATLAKSLQERLLDVLQDAADLRRRLALTGDDTVRAERATNERLTAALEAAEAEKHSAVAAEQVYHASTKKLLADAMAENAANERNLEILTTALGNAEKENAALRARVAELEALQAALGRLREIHPV